MRKFLVLVVVIAATVMLGVTDARADKATTFVNRSGQTLYIYYVMTPVGGSGDCGRMTYGGELQAGGSWAITVPPKTLAWVKLQRDTSSGGCGIGNNKHDSKVEGSSENTSETINVQ